MVGGINMKTILISIVMFFVFYSSGFAQTVEERIKVLEDALKKQEETIKAQQKLIEDLKAEMKQAKPPEQRAVAQPKETPAPSVTATTTQAATPEQMQQQVQELKEKVDQVVEAQKKNIPSVFNPSIGLVGETILSYNSKGSKQTGSDRPGGFRRLPTFGGTERGRIGRSVCARLCGDQCLCRPDYRRSHRDGGRGCDPNDLTAVEPDA